MKVLVCGGRHTRDREYVEWVLAKLGATVIIESGTLGAAYLAAEWARQKGFEVKTFRTERDQHGLDASRIRDRQMIQAGPDLVIVFPGDGMPTDVLKEARDAGIEVLLAENISAPQRADRDGPEGEDLEVSTGDLPSPPSEGDPG